MIAPSKESLHVALLVKALQGDRTAQLMLAPDPRRPERAHELTSLLAALSSRRAAAPWAFRAVVADSAFASLRDQAREAITGFYLLPSFPFVQLAALGYRLYFQTGVDDISPERVISRISPSPVLVIAGKGDDLIPEENGHRLYRAAREPKELWIIPVSGHGGTVAAAGAEYERRVGEFFDRHLGAP